MSFWGIEVKPAKPHPYHSDDVQGKLRVTQATLGLGSSKERSILQCSVGHRSPIFVCSLLPGKAESCSLNLEFTDELVAFSVIGPQSIHLCGYFDSVEGDHLRDEYEYDSGEDIADTESDESSEYDYDDEYDDDDDDLQMYSPSPVPKSGVVIEEITEDDKPTKENGKSKQLKKKNNQSSDKEDQNKSQRQIVLKRDRGISVLESEDEDGFPISSSSKSKDTVQEQQAELDGQKDKETTQETKKKMASEDNDDIRKKRKVKSVDQDGQLERKTKKKKKQRDRGTEAKVDEMDDKEEINKASRDEIESKQVKKQDSTNRNKHEQRDLDTDADSMPGEDSSDKKRKKNKKKKRTQDSGATTNDQAVSSAGGEARSSLESEDKQSTAKSSQVRTFSNGLVIEELAMGKPDGKRASPGSQVSVHYIGKLKNGKIFDSNVGRAPFKFRLGVGQVIKGWDVGVNGMRVGDKRRLTIPPSMGYGDRGAGGKIPPNSWLVFDVELVNAR
ncbi:PREDICTED: peptidyl-prolyl cis-trans isomerase FKBP53-like [Populus euphratica]|uniref:peptidylprolyl isomerase n=1 Tax=Populus euphratica TaxID=75702 RepID=A0AAJ6XT24_POPEU|nr:PREDICTED: peptidyl-prolyl cis-trans isomerase FKBP53-like [Populus euphratica]